MSKYLLQGSYVGEGLKGILEEAGSNRREAVDRLVQSLGGSVELFYHPFGNDDYCLIIDVPDSTSAAALALVARATGAVTVKATMLVTAEETNQPAPKSADCRSSGR